MIKERIARNKFVKSKSFVMCSHPEYVVDRSDARQEVVANLMLTLEDIMRCVDPLLDNVTRFGR